ncbi:carbon-nitrogen hydrolase family protein [Streptomyces sp. MST-110588]|uniref:carbon-nitrogen hydrolase family protein n=1 Tax=Streptomyces sp. MST-110588 TaxID=2833628 RepID=UPI001F5D3940|nr:carbon-nitrogen hydrolase family protein [Streptomyces sp. MST-110588]UNO38957.1 carbon-nitrogen hydrolase family protein [Streptomyces sp. MST-110588]
MSSLRTALLQSSGRPGDVAANLCTLRDTAREAASAGAGLLVCPELFLTGYAIGGDLHRLAEPADGDSAREVARIAAEYGIAILYGYPERAGALVHNSAQLIGPDGTRPANHRKTHLFGCFEHEWFTPGEVPVTQAELGGLRIGVMICYEVEFPELVRAHALAGTDLLLVPTAQMHPFQFVAESLVPVRAFESQMYIAYVNRVGQEGELEFVGLSCLAGPDGVVRARAGRGEQLVYAEADAEFLKRSRADNPYLHDRLPGLYGSLVRPQITALTPDH